MDKLSIKEAIVVEGRDDAAVVSQHNRCPDNTDPWVRYFREDLEAP